MAMLVAQVKASGLPADGLQADRRAGGERFADRGGMIQFLTQENKVRLKINLEASKFANLTISSKLLRPATVINPGD